jgi:hypothetical protein
VSDSAQRGAACGPKIDFLESARASDRSEGVSENIRYDVYLNGKFECAIVDPYPHQATTYLTLGIVNTIEVYAVDEAGNRSTASPDDRPENSVRG